VNVSRGKRPHLVLSVLQSSCPGLIGVVELKTILSLDSVDWGKIFGFRSCCTVLLTFTRELKCKYAGFPHEGSLHLYS
jgi:hypothetical protein